MNIYSFDEIKRQGDCLRFMEEVLGSVPVGRKSGQERRYDCPWRTGSDSGSFAVKSDGWYDHVAKEGGSILDLCARAKCSGNLFHAAEILGEWLRLTPSHKTATTRKVVKVYDYTDLLGLTVHQTVRYEPKSFAQRRPDPAQPGEYIYNLNGIEPVLYRWPDWSDSDRVIVVEGEKDADTLANAGFMSTTSPMGAGKWHASFSQALSGKTVFILPDNDQPGREHAQLVVSQLQGHAKSVHVVNLPGLPDKGDVSDWFAAGHGQDELTRLLQAATEVPTEQQPSQPPAAIAGVLEAKRANQTPFRNFTWQETTKDGGATSKEMRRPVHILALVRDLNTRFLGFPRMVGDTLFDHERNSGLIRFIGEPSELIAWISEKSGQLVEWARVEGAVSQEQLMASVRANVPRYQTISGIPCWPQRNDVYYTHGQLPPADPDHRILDAFLSMFCPATDADAILLRSFFASPLFYRLGVHKPLFVVDSTGGQGSGKSTLVNLLAMLYGGDDPSCASPVGLVQDDLTNIQQFDRITRRLMSATGRQKRVLLVDNVEGFFDSPALSALLTEPYLTGMAPYGRGEEHRPNDLTYCLTSNSATLSRDLIDRSVFIHVRKPDSATVGRVGWVGKVHEFIRSNRMQVIADIVGILERKAAFDFHPISRFPDWESEVMAPMSGSADAFDEAWKAVLSRRTSADGDAEEAETIRAYFSERLAEKGLKPETDPVWIQSDVIKLWCAQAIHGFGGRDSRSASQKIRNLIKAGFLPEMSVTIEIYPHHGTNRRRGIMWNFDIQDNDAYQGEVYIAKLDGETVRITS